MAGSLGRDFSWALSSNIIYSACQWGLVIEIAKLGTPADVGAYALGLAITSPILIFASFQARNLVASDAHNEYNFNEYLTFRLTSLLVALFVLCGVVAVTRTSLSGAVVILSVGLGQSFDCTSETYFGLLQKHGRLDRVSLSLMLKGPLCLLLLGITMRLTHDIRYAVAALAAGRCLILVFVDIHNAHVVSGCHRLIWNWATQVRLLLTALPLGVISGLAAVNLNIPRYFIEWDLNKHDLGIFSALASLVGAGNLVIAAFASCTIVGLANAWATGDKRQYRSLSLRFLAISAVMGSAGVFVALLGGDRLLAMIFGSDYVGNAAVLAHIMIAGALGYLVSAQGYTMTAARKLFQQIPALLAAAAVTGLSCWYLVPKRGLTGAADSWVLGLVFLLAWNTILLARMGVRSTPSSAWSASTVTQVLEKE